MQRYAISGRTPSGWWSGRWDSNPRSRAPKARALPTTPLPHPLTPSFGALRLALLTVLFRLRLLGLRFLVALAFGLIDLGAEILDGRCADARPRRDLECGLAWPLGSHLVPLEGDLPLVDRPEQAIERARVVGALDRGVGDQIAQVEDDAILEVQEHLRDRAADGVLDLVQTALGLLVVDSLAGRVGHLADLARELVPQARRAVAGRAQRILRTGRGQARLAQADGGGQIRQFIGRASTFDVVARDAAASRDHDRAVVVLDVPPGALPDEGVLGLGLRGGGLGAVGGFAHRALGLVADTGERTADTTPLLLEQVRRLGMDVGDIGTDPHELLDGNVARPLGRIREDAAGQLEAEDPPGRLVEVDVVDLALVVACLGEHACPEQRLVARDNGPDLGHLVRRDHTLASGDDHRVATEADDFLDGDDEGARKEPAFIGKQSDDVVVAGAEDDVLDLVQTCPVRQAQDRLADHALALAHDGLLQDRREEVEEGHHRDDGQHHQDDGGQASTVRRPLKPHADESFLYARSEHPGRPAREARRL